MYVQNHISQPEANAMIERFLATANSGALMYATCVIPMEAITAIQSQNPFQDLQVNVEVLPTHMAITMGTNADGITVPILRGALVSEETGDIIILDDPVVQKYPESSVIMDRVVDVRPPKPIKVGRY